MNPLAIFQYPFVIKQVNEFLLVTVPDFEVHVSDIIPANESLNKDYVTRVNKLLIRAAKLVIEKQRQLEEVGKKHYHPPSYINQTIQIKNKESISAKTAAKYLGISERTLRRWELDGVIRSTKTRGGHRSFNLAELDRVKAQMQSSERPMTANEESLEQLRMKMPQITEKLPKHQSIKELDLK